MTKMTKSEIKARLKRFTPNFLCVALDEQNLYAGTAASDTVEEIILLYADVNNCSVEEAIARLSESPEYETASFSNVTLHDGQDISQIPSDKLPWILLCDVVNAAIYGGTDDWWQFIRTSGQEKDEIFIRQRRKQLH